VRADTPNEVDIRELERNDLVGMARCIALDGDSFPYPSLPLGLPAGLQTLVAQAGNRVVGFLTSTASGSTRYMHGVAVAADARRRGIGRALVRACVASAGRSGLRSVILHVGVANRPAVALYDAEGFEVRRVLRNFYRPGLYASRDAYELALYLRSVHPPATT
jgi:ribosomal-protein-alanine N-acetyltransferase